MRRFICMLAAAVFAALISEAAQIPPLTGPAGPGDAQLADYFRDQVLALSSNCLANVNTLADWTSKRAEYRRQLAEMLGLWPMPPRGDLKPVITGRINHGDFTVEKLYYQALPKLYITANLYLPTNLDRPAPTVLYLCGHWRTKIDGISYGNKAVYQRDGAWYARNGYVCLVPDTVLAGEIEGIHTGTRDHGLWWWNSRGYTPAGIEAFLGIRALDYLCSLPEVDTNRIGVTGHSGGGAYTWTVTALDDRVKVAAPLAGMADMRSHMLDGVIDDHCDCNFFINIYHWDFPQVAALAAPRPLLIGGTDRDQLFHLDSTLRIYEKVRHIYELYGVVTNLGLAYAPGIHDETPELQLAVMRWFNRYLKGTDVPVDTVAQSFFTPQQLKVFKTLPSDSINSNIASYFVPMFDESGSRRESAHSSPGNQSRLTSAATNSSQLRAELLAKVFTGWPEENLPLDVKSAFDIRQGDLRLRAWDFSSQPDVRLRVYLLDDAAAKPVESISLSVLDERGADDWLADVRTLAGARGRFSQNLAGEFAGQNLPVANEAALDKLKREVLDQHEALAFFAPRGIGLDAWSGGIKRLTKIRRRFMLLGQTMDGMRVWDIRRVMQALHSVAGANSSDLSLHAEGGMAVNALYAALFQPEVRRLDLVDLPKTHMEATTPDYLGVLKFTDIPEVTQAVASQADVKLETQ